MKLFRVPVMVSTWAMIGQFWYIHLFKKETESDLGKLISHVAICGARVPDRLPSVKRVLAEKHVLRGR